MTKLLPVRAAVRTVVEAAWQRLPRCDVFYRGRRVRADQPLPDCSGAGEGRVPQRADLFPHCVGLDEAGRRLGDALPQGWECRLLHVRRRDHDLACGEIRRGPAAAESRRGRGPTWPRSRPIPSAGPRTASIYLKITTHNTVSHIQPRARAMVPYHCPRGLGGPSPGFDCPGYVCAAAQAALCV